ncbi:MAG: glutamate racemase [Brevinema sp.]
MIGVFDSGLGGLTILKELSSRLPNHPFTYIADYKNLPYGTKSLEELTAIAEELLEYFRDCEAIVIACNTLSGLLTKGYIDRSKYPPIIDMISCLSQEFLSHAKEQNLIGILATKFTIDLGEYTRLIALRHPENHIISVAATNLVTAIESEDPNLDKILKGYLEQFPNDLSHLILGCTHYNTLKTQIQTILPHVTIVDPYLNIVKTLNHFNIKSSSAPIKFLRTKELASSSRLAEQIMDQKIIWEDITL